jgi:hypothetical protein
MEKAMPAIDGNGASKHSLPCRERIPARTAVPGENCDRYLGLLREFYKTHPEHPGIDVSFVPPDSLPQPQRSLLVHFTDMTSTLSRHYGEPIALRPLERHESPQWYRRHIVLETATTHRPVEYGAMRVLLPLLSEAARAEVLEAKLPLGSILTRHKLNFRHCPGGFFRIHTNHLIEQALKLSWPQWLYGRCNCMSDEVGRVVAEVIEVLPP